VSVATLAGIAVLLGAAALWELAGARGEELARLTRNALGALTGGRVRTIGAAALRLRLPQRLQRAGLEDRLPVAAVLAGKLAGAGLGGLAAALALPAVPGRLSPLVALGLPAAGFVAPEALLERAARRRGARILAALPEALDLIAVGAAAGRSAATVLAEISRADRDGRGPLAAELAIAAAEIECGVPQREAVAALRERNGSGAGLGPGLGALSAALERSRRFGSPLADQLHEQAISLRREARRRVEERAARAAPKIQLVVALVLVPSVLLSICAALLAHAGALVGVV
jgi:tight adherence protein C